MGMIAEIVTQLKTGTITNVIPFGVTTKMPTPPYVVVKPELYITGRGFRVYVHYSLGSQMYTKSSVNYTPLEDYIYNELPSLIKDWSFINNHGETMTVRDTGEITDVNAVSDDNTVSMDRLFYIAQPK